MGMMRPEEAARVEREGQAISRVYDPDLGVWRSVRANGQIVEECVSSASPSLALATSFFQVHLCSISKKS